MTARKDSGRIALPVALIAAGVLSLFYNLGLLRWDLWNGIIRLWPLLLIAFGFALLVGRGSLRWGLVLVLLAILAAIYFEIGSAFFEARFSRCPIDVPPAEETVTQGRRESLEQKRVAAGKKGEFSLGSQYLSALPVPPHSDDRSGKLRLTPRVTLLEDGYLCLG